jgi:hypothetical protein
LLWAFAAAGGMGLLLGLLWFRVLVLVPVSGVAAAAYVWFAPLMGLGLMPALVFTFALLGVLQVGYLAGFILSYDWTSEPLHRGRPRAR